MEEDSIFILAQSIGRKACILEDGLYVIMKDGHIMREGEYDDILKYLRRVIRQRENKEKYKNSEIKLDKSNVI